MRRRRPFALSLSPPAPFPFLPSQRLLRDLSVVLCQARVGPAKHVRVVRREEYVGVFKVALGREMSGGAGEEKEFGWFRRSVRFGFGVGGSHKSKQQKRLTRKQMKTNMGRRTARAPMPESGRRRKAGGKTAMACSSAAISQ